MPLVMLPEYESVLVYERRTLVYHHSGGIWLFRPFAGLV